MARKAIFITGGGSGIGRAVARHFAAQGWFVGIADVNRAGIDETAALLTDGASSRHVMDVRDRDQWAAALGEFAEESGGRLDVLFNNAGIGTGGQLTESSRKSSLVLCDKWLIFRGDHLRHVPYVGGRDR